ncbi:MAG: hypothetical protein ACRDY2_09755, partial [Acidimicrobiales bacterium]
PAAVADRVGTSLGGIMIRRLESLARRMEAEMDTSQRNLTRKMADLTSTHQVTWQGQETTLAALPGQVAAAIGARIAAPVEDLASSVPIRLASILEQKLAHQRRDLESRFGALSDVLERRTTVVERLGATLERLGVTLEKRATHSDAEIVEGFARMDTSMAGVVDTVAVAAGVVNGVGASMGRVEVAVEGIGAGVDGLGALASEVGALRQRLDQLATQVGALVESQAAGLASLAGQVAKLAQRQEAGQAALAASLDQVAKATEGQVDRLRELPAELVASRKGRHLF